MSDLPEETRRKVLCDTVAKVYNKPIPTPIETPSVTVSEDDFSRRAQFHR
jgi:hypothetical protein